MNGCAIGSTDLRARLAGAWLAACCAAAALGQSAPWPSRVVAYRVDSGPVESALSPVEREVVYSTVVFVPGAQWLRLLLGEVHLAGDPAGNGSYLLVTSLADGDAQILNAEHLDQWRNTSAYFNGDAVLVELVSYGGTGASVLVLDGVLAGEASGQVVADLCGSDDRVLSNDPRVARHPGAGCTAFMINDVNSQFLTAGHCGAVAQQVIQFNVPLSNGQGNIVNPPASEQYAVEPSSSQGFDGPVGDDWHYFGVFPNSVTGLQPYQAQAARFTMALPPPSPTGQSIRITGYGTVEPPVPPEWNQALTTDVGPMGQVVGTSIRYFTDTSSGNSGSPIIHENSGQCVGIHTNAGCGLGGNRGTTFVNGGLQNALANPLGICRAGQGPIAPPLYVIGDQVNHFGTADTSTGSFGMVAQVGAKWQGLAYSTDAGVLYAVNTDRQLFTIDPNSGAATLLGTLSGSPGTITAMTYDRVNKRIVGMLQNTGQLAAIDPNALTATGFGASTFGNVGGLAFDPTSGKLYGVDDTAAGTRLVSFDPNTGAKATIGALGAGINDCNGMAYVDAEDALFTIDAGSENLLRVDRQTGAATVVGNTGSLFGSAYGMEAIPSVPPPGCPGDLDGDHATGQADLGILLAAYGTCEGDPLYNPLPAGLAEPLNCVDQADLGVLLANYGCGG